MFLESPEEALDLLEDNDERIVTRNNALCRLYELCMRPLRVREIQDNSYRKEDTGTSENDIRGFNYLQI
jgi:hypothetical protein